jgi:hypothetical protein
MGKRAQPFFASRELSGLLVRRSLRHRRLGRRHVRARGRNRARRPAARAWSTLARPVRGSAPRDRGSAGSRPHVRVAQGNAGDLHRQPGLAGVSRDWALHRRGPRRPEPGAFRRPGPRPKPEPRDVPDRSPQLGELLVAAGTAAARSDVASAEGLLRARRDGWTEHARRRARDERRDSPALARRRSRASRPPSRA